MSPEITAEQVNEVMTKHNDFWSPESDLTNEAVRGHAKYLRNAADFPDADYADNMVQSAELDRLVDRIETDADR